jgi:hypothetical protein
MKKLIVIALLSISLLCGGIAVFVHYQRKHEDDVAYFALNAIHERAWKTDCKAVADASYKEHCMSTVVEMRKWLRDRPYYTSNDLLRENMDCLLRNFDTWDAAHNACYRQKDAEEAEALRVWEEKYPRQAANLKRDALENARKRDARAAAKK